MEKDNGVANAALTAAFLQLCGTLAQRRLIDRGDLADLEDIMLTALRKTEDRDPHRQQRELLQTWLHRAMEVAPESLPLPEREQYGSDGEEPE